jgi:hypothetical protein
VFFAPVEDALDAISFLFGYESFVGRLIGDAVVVELLPVVDAFAQDLVEDAALEALAA